MQQELRSTARGIEAYWEPISPIELIELGSIVSKAIRIAPVDQLQAYVTNVFEVERCGPIGIFEFLLDRSANRICMAYSRAYASTIDGKMTPTIASTRPVWIPTIDVDFAAEALHDICRDSNWRTN